jgi:cytidine deaminase
MRKKDISFSYLEIDKQEDLTPDDLELLLSAQKVALNAYAPYSKFRVGAAIRLESGKIVTGANVENAAFPSGICAERNALSTASSNYPDDKPAALAIAALNESGLTTDPVSPCGNCRQVIAEEEFRNNKNIRIILGGGNKIEIIEKGGDLLPLQFSMKNLKVDLH